MGLCLRTVFPEETVGCLCLGTSDPLPYLSSPPAHVLPILLSPGWCGAAGTAASHLPWQGSLSASGAAPLPRPTATRLCSLGAGRTGGPNWSLLGEPALRSAGGGSCLTLITAVMLFFSVPR